jgi:hypothetical protein
MVRGLSRPWTCAGLCLVQRPSSSLTLRVTVRNVPIKAKAVNSAGEVRT